MSLRASGAFFEVDDEGSGRGPLPCFRHKFRDGLWVVPRETVSEGVWGGWGPTEPAGVIMRARCRAFDDRASSAFEHRTVLLYQPEPLDEDVSAEVELRFFRDLGQKVPNEIEWEYEEGDTVARRAARWMYAMRPDYDPNRSYVLELWFEFLYDWYYTAVFQTGGTQEPRAWVDWFRQLHQALDGDPVVRTMRAFLAFVVHASIYLERSPGGPDWVRHRRRNGSRDASSPTARPRVIYPLAPALLAEPGAEGDAAFVEASAIWLARLANLPRDPVFVRPSSPFYWYALGAPTFVEDLLRVMVRIGCEWWYTAGTRSPSMALRRYTAGRELQRFLRSASKWTWAFPIVMAEARCTTAVFERAARATIDAGARENRTMAASPLTAEGWLAHKVRPHFYKLYGMLVDRLEGASEKGTTAFVREAVVQTAWTHVVGWGVGAVVAALLWREVAPEPVGVKAALRGCLLQWIGAWAVLVGYGLTGVWLAWRARAHLWDASGLPLAAAVVLAITALYDMGVFKLELSPTVDGLVGTTALFACWVLYFGAIRTMMWFVPNADGRLPPASALLSWDRSERDHSGVHWFRSSFSAALWFVARGAFLAASIVVVTYGLFHPMDVGQERSLFICSPSYWWLLRNTGLGLFLAVFIERLAGRLRRTESDVGV